MTLQQALQNIAVRAGVPLGNKNAEKGHTHRNSNGYAGPFVCRNRNCKNIHEIYNTPGGKCPGCGKEGLGWYEKDPLGNSNG